MGITVLRVLCPLAALSCAALLAFELMDDAYWGAALMLVCVVVNVWNTYRAWSL